jgi:hypothetical protein
MPNQQEHRKKEALRKKRELLAEAQGIGANNGELTITVAVVANNLFSTHRNLFMIREINDFMAHNALVNITVFLHDTAVPMIAPHFPIFGVHDLHSLCDPIIATDITTCFDALDSQSDRIVHYVFDLEPERRDLDLARLRSVYQDPRVTVVCRSHDHWSVLAEEFNIKARQRIVQDFDLTLLLTVLGESHETACPD